MNPMPPKAHLSAPRNQDVHTVIECDEILARGCPTEEIANAWLDERISAMRTVTAANLDKHLEYVVGG